QIRRVGTLAISITSRVAASKNIATTRTSAVYFASTSSTNSLYGSGRPASFQRLFRPGSSRRAFRPKPINCRQAANGLHEIKHDGFRVIARKKGAQVRLYSRPGNDLTYRFSLIVETLKRLRSRSCIIDGEAVACDENGLTSFNRVRCRRHDESTFLYAF